MRLVRIKRQLRRLLCESHVILQVVSTSLSVFVALVVVLSDEFEEELAVVIVVVVFKSIDSKLTSSYICQEFVQGQLITRIIDRDERLLLKKN